MKNRNKLPYFSYLEEKLRYDRALEWDQKEARIMLEFRKKREEMLLRDQAMK